MTTATQTQIRRDTATNLNAATPAQGELGYDTTNKRLVVGDGATAGGIRHISAKDYQNQTFINWTVGGSANAITLTVPSGLSAVGAYTDGLKMNFKAGSTNTGGVTVNVDGLGAQNVYKMSNGALTALIANDIISGGKYDIIYDGTQFQIKGLSEGPYTSGALVFLGSKTASASSVIDLTSMLSSTYDDYMIVIDGVTSSTNNAQLELRVSTNNGSTFDTGSNYHYNNFVVTTSLTSDSTGGSVSFIYCSYGLPTTSAAANALSGKVYLHNANDTNGAQSLTGQLVHSQGNGYDVHGNWGGTGPVNALRFLMSSGNIATGTFKVYGIAKS